MTTFEKGRHISLVMHIFEANDAILVLLIFLTVMVTLVVTLLQTTFAFLAEKENFWRTFMTVVALFTMVQSLSNSSVIVEGTVLAVIQGKIFFTIRAGGPFGLLCEAAQASHVSNSKLIHKVILLWIHLIIEVDLIVAQSASIKFSVAARVRTLHLARAIDVLTSVCSVLVIIIGHITVII